MEQWTVVHHFETMVLRIKQCYTICGLWFEQYELSNLLNGTKVEPKKNEML
jgi:hypothetical protein